MSAECRQFEYRAPWVVIGGFVYFSALLVLGGVGVVAEWDPYRDFTASLILYVATMFVALVGVGLFFGWLAWRTLLNRLSRRQRITLTETALILPQQFWSTSEFTVPYDSITAVRGKFSRIGKHMIISSTVRQCRIASGTLANRADMDELVGTLSERLKPFDVQIEWRETWFGGRWTRPQFSILSLLILTTVVAVVLGLSLCLGREDLPRFLAVSACQMILMGTPLLALVPWRRPGFLFAAGYVIGGLAEWTVVSYLVKHDLIQFVPGTLTPRGWYPLMLPIERMILAAGWTDELGAVIWGMWAGCFVSGVLAGTGFVATWYLVACVVRRLRRRRPTNP